MKRIVTMDSRFFVFYFFFANHTECLFCWISLGTILLQYYGCGYFYLCTDLPTPPPLLLPEPSYHHRIHSEMFQTSIRYNPRL